MATFHERITGTGEGVRVERTGTPKKEEHTKHFVGVPKGHRITEEEALELGRELFDAIARERAQDDRQTEDPRGVEDEK